IPFDLVIRTFAGLRAKGSTNDFIIYENKQHAHFINVAGIDSPGIASAPAISRYVINNFFHDLQLKENYTIKRRGYYHFDTLDEASKTRLIEQDPKFGHIICRCEKISEQEIIDCIHRPLVPKTLKAIKKRIRPGMGRCQGGFCAPLIIKIIAKELNIPEDQVCYDAYDSKILCHESKGDDHA
ncbi:MAG: (2Fe-2S)-binding protein, partial [Erysipelotrichaceae bacterium]|nr:(2Fe-2S)-binding protein [Erysipelotrichaceae bacterium]